MIERTEKEITANWNMSKPLVSICTITYNHEKFIEDALDSFLMQETDFPFEITIDDDASTDNTRQIIEKYIEKYPNLFNANLRDKNVGSVPNFLSNIKRARGKYIALCEGDDYWTDPKKLQKQVDILENDPEICLVGHGAEVHYYDEKNEKIIDRQLLHSKFIATSKIVKPYEFVKHYFMQTATVCFRKNIITKEFYIDTINYPIGDIPLYLHISKNGKVFFLNETMSIYRRKRTGYWESNTKNIDFLEKLIFYYEDLIKKCQDKNVSNILQGYMSMYLIDLAKLYWSKNKKTLATKYIIKNFKTNPIYIPKIILVKYTHEDILHILLNIKAKLKKLLRK